MHRTLAILALTACLPVANEPAGPHQPTLAEVSTAADAALDLVDRDAVLATASEGAPGVAPDLANAPSAFFMQIDSEEMQAALESATGRRFIPTYENVFAAAAAVVVADLATVAVVGPPAAAIAFAGDGLLVEVTPSLWSATNIAVGPDGSSATLTLNVAYVGVGWLAEMRVTSSDGLYDNTLWFNGFLSADGALGWWDLYSGDVVAGVIEWIVLPDGSYEAAIGSLSGDTNGDVLAYVGAATGESAVAYDDASAGFLSYVLLRPDNSGETALLDFKGGARSCWDTAWADAACE